MNLRTWTRLPREWVAPYRLAGPNAKPAMDACRYALIGAEREAALAASRAKTVFLANMSHEIRTPMNAMLGMADLLAETALSAEQRRFLGIMINNGNTLLRLVNDMLDFARVESGRVKPERAEFGLIELIEGIAETLAPQAHRKGLESVTRVAPDVPPLLIGDARRLRQILINLIGNAIKFTVTGEVALEVKREAGAPGMLRFTVIDTGVGIDPADHERIFASYAQAESLVAIKAAGSGLGLAIVKQLAELMDGRVWLESQPGTGSSFHCSVRLGYRPRANLPGEYGRKRILAGRRVLIIAGGMHSRAALAAIVAVHGAAVVQAASVEEAVALIDKCTSEKAGTVLFDVPAADSDHAATIARVKDALPPDTRLLPLIPMHDRNAKQAMLQALGLKHYLIKPVRRAELIEALRESSGPKAIGATPRHRRSHTAREWEAEGHLPPIDLPLRILIADDAEDNRVLIEAYLRYSGCQLDQVDNGADAVKKILAHHYDVVLMDLHMPVMDGYTAIRRLREWEQAHRSPRTPVIALTAAVLEDAVRESLEAGCDRHLSKPVKRAMLFAALRDVTAARNQARLG